MTPVENLNMILGIVISVSTIISVAALGVRWLVKHYFDEIKKELKPNSGSSLKDQVSRLEQGHKKLEENQKLLEQKLDTVINYIIGEKK